MVERYPKPSRSVERVAPGQKPIEVSPFDYWSRMAVMLARQRDKSSIYFYESIFAGAALLFLYFGAISPPSRRFDIIDGFILVVVVGCTQIVAAHYDRLARKSRDQLDEAIKEATKAADQPPKAR